MSIDLKEFIEKVFNPNDVNSSVFQDPIHGYIDTNFYIKKIIKNRYFLRLKSIKQNSTTFYTYSSCLGTRFEHSLGVMHLSGLMIENALKRIEWDSRINYYKIFCKEFNLCYENTPIKTAQQIRENHSLIASFLVFIVKICGLLHDIGHLPLSHLLEETFEGELYSLYKEEDINKKIKIHEFHSIKIAEIVLKESNKKLIEEKEISPDLIQKITNIILLLLKNIYHINKDSDSELNTILTSLSFFISSDLDADRCDYLLRDPRNAGTNFGNFDLQRYIRFISFKENSFYPDKKAISTIETILSSRYYLYKWVFHHHHVIFTESLIRISIRILNEIRNELKESDFSLPKEKLNFFHPHNFTWFNYCFKSEIEKNEQKNYSQKGGKEPFFQDYHLNFILDDNALWQKLSEIYFHIKKHDENNQKLHHKENILLQMLSFFFEDKKIFKSCWKTVADYSECINYIDKTNLNNALKLKDCLKKVIQEKTSATILDLNLEKDFNNNLFNYLLFLLQTSYNFFIKNKRKEDPFINPIDPIERFNDEYFFKEKNTDSCFIAIKSFQPYTPDGLDLKSKLQIYSNGELVKIDMLSKSLEGLKRMWREDIQLWAFYIPAEKEENPEKIKRLVNNIAKSLLLTLEDSIQNIENLC